MLKEGLIMANKVRITLDPGHSWNVNQGAVKTYYESNYMYDFAQQLKGALEKYGIFEVYVTKKVLKENPSLYQRAMTAVNTGSRMLISLHTNACGDNVTYRSVIYNSCKRKAYEYFAKNLNATIAAVFNKYTGQSKNANIAYRINDVGTDYYGILRNATQTDSVQYVMLFEHDFHTCLKQCVGMTTEGFWETMAAEVAKVIYGELKQYYVGDNIATYSGTVTSTLNVRADHNTSSQRIGSLKKGDTVKIISKVKLDDIWYKILWNGASAWVAGWVINTNERIIPDDSTIKIQLPNVLVDDHDVPTPSIPEITDDILVSKYYINIHATLTDDNVGKVDTPDGLNVRTGPGTQYAKLDCLENGTLVSIYPRNPIPSNLTDPMVGWLYINYLTEDGILKRGFVCADYVKAAEIVTPRAMINCTNGLNYRNGPGTTYKKFGCLPYKTVVYTLGTSDGWTKIRLMDKSDTATYWVSSQYLTELPETDEETFLRGYQDCDYGKATISVTIRSNPSVNAANIGTLKKDSICCISSLVNNNEWARIICATNYGYVQTKYLNLLGHRGDEEDYEVDSTIYPILSKLSEMSASEWFIETLGAKISSPYGWRTSPINGGSEFHTGIDFACAGGTPIHTDVDGICTFNAYDSSCGNMCILLDEQGKQHRFYHMKSAALPKVGEFVHAGELVGYVGTTGDSTGNHLHYEVRVAPWQRNNTIDPTHLSFQ